MSAALFGFWVTFAGDLSGNGENIVAATAGKAKSIMASKCDWGCSSSEIYLNLRARKLGRVVPPTPTLAELEAQLHAFQKIAPPGTLVRYWKGVREGEPTGYGKLRLADILSGHTAVAWIEGCSGCVALTHVEVVP